MAGTREGLELRSEFSWNTEPLRLLKGSGSWAELNVPRNIVFGTELTTEDGGLREPVTLLSSIWNSNDSRLEIKLRATLNPTNDDLVFNRLAIVRGGKQQGSYTADLDDILNTVTITSPILEPWSIGDKLVDENFNSYTVTGISGTSNEVLTVSETIATSETGISVHDASGTIMVVYVFVQEATIFQNSSVILEVSGYSFAA
jgi:hypothetical protein